MNTVRTSKNKQANKQKNPRNFNKVPNRSQRTEEYNNWTEKFTTGVQPQTGWKRRTDQGAGRQSTGAHQDRAAQME